MILLKAENEDNFALIIGLGLIGSFVLKRFFKLNWFKTKEVEVNWHQSEFFKTEFLIWITANLNSSVKKLDLIWSAGKSGFGSEEFECRIENNHFKNFLESVEQISLNRPINLKIHLLSSAGALFEGQLGVNEHSIPMPKRPYGFSKLWQEQFLISKFPNKHIIYRSSSVYGPIQNGFRQGLVSKMIKSLKNNSEIVIFGGMSTLRDFIWVEDIARPIVDNTIGHSSNERNILFLVSAKPTSILEVDELIKKITRKSVFYRFSKNMDFSSMSFSEQVKSNSTLNLELGIKLIYINF